MILVFGRNRRQKPLELRCPGGRIVVSRAPHGTIEIQLIAENGKIEHKDTNAAWHQTVRLVHEEREDA